MLVNFFMSKWRCPKCGKEFTDEELNERWEKGKGPKKVERFDPVGAYLGALFGGMLGAILGPIGALFGGIVGAAVLGKETKENPKKCKCSCD